MSCDVITFIGRGPTVEDAIHDAERRVGELAVGMDDSLVWVGVSAQTFWNEAAQMFYHTITTAWQWRAPVEQRPA